MMGRFVRGMLLGLLFVLAVGIWPAGANVDQSYTKVTAPANGSAIQGRYDADGKPTGFEQAIRGQAKTQCTEGFSEIKFSITGPGGYTKSYPTISTSSGSSWDGGPSTPWDTQPLDLNGVYSVRMTVTDNTSGILNGCKSNTYPTKADVKVVNAPQTPEWTTAPAAAADGSPNVSLKWKKNPEGDVESYHITRTGPDGSRTAVVPTSACGSSCEISDAPGNFPAEYSGTYTYQIVTYRSAPSGSGEECSAGSSARCVKSSGSEIRSVTLTKPTPSPTPTDSPTNSPSPTTGGGGNNSGGGNGGSTNSSNKNRSTRVLSFGGGGGGFANDFYSGTYDENLPYQPKTLVIGNGKTTTPSDSRTEAAAFSEDPPNYRTIMLPVAGGLLAFLSAAHVRRLLIHF